MKKHILFSVVFLTSLQLWAGSMSLSCESADKLVSFSVGTFGTYKMTINLNDTLTKQPANISADASAPFYDNEANSNPKAIMALPVSAKKSISSVHEVMHVIHADKTDCYGRQRWDVNYSQDFLLAMGDGTQLYFNGNQVEGTNDDGYLPVNLICRDYGITTAGGCSPGEGDTFEWVPDTNW